MKRITVFVSRYCLPLVGAATVAMTIIAGAVFILHGLIVRLMDMFSSPPDPMYYSGILELMLILIPMMVGGMFMFFTRAEKTDRTAELLFGTPLSVREYMFSFWFCLLFGCIMMTPVVMGVFVLVAGIEHLADAPPTHLGTNLASVDNMGICGRLAGKDIDDEQSAKKDPLWLYRLFATFACYSGGNDSHL
ncbi:hypothetical protein M1O54_02155 [Dehalococcoidia bacterium]|nr:hypothetical protein [Dehalococcoidia bacterium]